MSKLCKHRLIVLTDIARGFEQDDIQSMVRLMLYTNEIEVEGLIATTSCFYQNGGREENRRIILDIIDAYAQVYPKLQVHAEGYPSADDLRAVTHCGIPAFGDTFGNGWGHEKWNDVEGVQRIINSVDKNDPRPVWVALWGGCNTLAQAIWLVHQTRSTPHFNLFLSKLRIYGISDQDYAARWLRDNYGEKLFYIVSPSPGGTESVPYFKHATWPGISGDCFDHGSEDGFQGGGFSGADAAKISASWLADNIMRGVLGAQYPPVKFLMEGDTPSFLGLIPNGLNCPEHPDYGGWGGRYTYHIPDAAITGTVEPFPVWGSDADQVRGMDGEEHTSPQATIWRWREAIQHDFAARMQWTETFTYAHANHPPQVKITGNKRLTVEPGDTVLLDASLSTDPNGHALTYAWFHYPEAGGNAVRIQVPHPNHSTVMVNMPQEAGTYHFIVAVTNQGTPRLTRYGRIMVTINTPTEQS